MGGGLLLLSQVLFLISNVDDKISISTIITGGVQLLIGLILFQYCDDSISMIKEKLTNPNILDDGINSDK